MSTFEEREIARLKAENEKLKEEREILRLKTENEKLKAELGRADAPQRTTTKPKKALPYGGLCEGGPWNGGCYSCAELRFELAWAGGEYRFEKGRWVWHRKGA